MRHFPAFDRGRELLSGAYVETMCAGKVVLRAPCVTGDENSLDISGVRQILHQIDSVFEDAERMQAILELIVRSAEKVRDCPELNSVPRAYIRLAQDLLGCATGPRAR